MSDSYSRLISLLKRAHVLGTVSGLLGWDEQVFLPPDSADLRAEQLALLAELDHEASAHPEIGRLLSELEAPAVLAKLDASAQVVVREARRDYDRVTKLPPAFVAEKARLCSAAYHAWADARARSDFAAYAPFLQQHLDLAKREAAYLGWGDRPYDYAIDQHDPGMDAARIGVLFAELKEGLVPLVRQIAASPVRANPSLLRGFPVADQLAFLREVTASLGFNYQRGRIDVSLHPFCSGPGADIRMTTRFDPDSPLDSLFGSIHETGHGLYEQGLPLEHQGTPLGENAGMAVHESQSRLWENQVARGRPFWRHFEPRFRALFPTQLAGVSSEDLYLAINAVEPTLIRVESDEIHYNLHILLRFDIERRLFSGELAVADLPAAWNALSKELLGLTPANDREGVLQDVHWSGGAFGYFPSYCLGNMIAAQLWTTVRKELPTPEDDFARGDFSRLLGWLRTHIHAQGRRFDARALVREVTGTELSPQPLLAYLRERYLPLYGS
ncbi:MAG TPA: carboxypeptidase M32 [Opitutaceae bacterium]